MEGYKDEIWKQMKELSMMDTIILHRTSKYVKRMFGLGIYGEDVMKMTYDRLTNEFELDDEQIDLLCTLN